MNCISFILHLPIHRSPLTRVYDAQRKQHKTEWLNTPNTYKKEEMQEVGTPNPKTYTKVSNVAYISIKQLSDTVLFTGN